MVSDYVENASLSDARKAASGITDVVLGGASSLAVSVFGDAAVERVKEEVVDASAALVGLFPESHRPEAKTLATSVALGLGGLAVGVPFVPGITDNLLVGGVGAAWHARVSFPSSSTVVASRRASAALRSWPQSSYCSTRARCAPSSKKPAGGAKPGEDGSLRAQMRFHNRYARLRALRWQAMDLRWEATLPDIARRMWQEAGKPRQAGVVGETLEERIVDAVGRAA